MIRIEKNKAITGNKRFVVSDVPDMSTPAGTAKTQDEFRKLAMDLNDFADSVDKKLGGGDAGPAATPTTDTGGKTPKTPTAKDDLQVWQDYTKKVSDVTIWDFVKSADVTFKVTQLSKGHAVIQAFTNYKNPFNVMWGTRTGGYSLEVDSFGYHPVTFYPGDPTGEARPFTVQPSRSLIHFLGDAGLFEPSESTITRLGYNADKPAHDTAVWGVKTVPTTLFGETYDVSVIKVRVTPTLQVIGDPSRGSTISGENSSPNLTRIQFYDSSTVTPHVERHPTTGWDNAAKIYFDVNDDAFSIANVGGGAGIYKTRVGREFKLKSLQPGTNITFSISDDTITINSAGGGGGGSLTYTAASLGSPGTNIEAVYSTTVGTEFKFKRIKATGALQATSDTDYVILTPYAVSGLAYGTCAAVSTPYNFYHDTVQDDTGHTVKLRLRNFNVTNDLFLDVCAGGAMVFNVDVSTLDAGTGVGLTYGKIHSGQQTQLKLRNIKAGDGISVDLSSPTDNDIVISAIPINPIFRNAGADIGEIHISTRANGAVLTFDTASLAVTIPVGKHYCTTTGGSGTGLTVLVIKTVTTTDLYIIDPGTGYVVGDTVNIVGIPTSTAHVGAISTIDPVVSLKTLSVLGDLYLSQTEYDITYYHTVALNSVAGADTSTVKTLSASRTSINGDVLLGIKSLEAGSNITLTATGTKVRIDAATGGSGSPPLYYDFTSLGSQTPITINKTGSGTIGDPYMFNFKSFQAGTNIDFSGSTANVLKINSTYTDTNDLYTVQNVGTGTGHIWRDTSSGNPHLVSLRTLKQAGGTVITDGANEVTIGSYLTTAIPYGSCLTLATPYNFLYDVVDNPSDPSKTIRIRNFNITGDLNIQECGLGAYVINSDVVGLNEGGGIEIYDTKIKVSGQTQLKMRSLIAGTNINIDYSSGGDGVVISCTAVNDTYTFSNLGSGEGHVWATLSAGPAHTVGFKTIKAGANTSISETATEITISSLPQLYYAVSNVGSGAPIFNGTVSGAGTSGSPYTSQLKSIVQGVGAVIATTANEITVSFRLKVSVDGIVQDYVTELDIDSNAYDIGFVHQTGTANKSVITPKWLGYSFKADGGFWVDAGIKVPAKIIPNNTWETILFDNVVIADAPGYVHKDPSATPIWYFLPDDVADFNWRVIVKIAMVSRHPTSNTQPATMNMPQIALFVNDVFWDYLWVDEMVGAFASVRQYLANSDPLLGSSVPESGSKSWLAGSDVVRLVNNTDKLTVKFKHITGADRWMKILKASISISKIGEVNTRTANPVEHEVDFTLF